MEKLSSFSAGHGYSLSGTGSLAELFSLRLPAALYQTARAVHPDSTTSDALARVKYFVRGMVSPRLTSEWFALLSSPAFAPLVQQHPHILSKLQRPYLHRRLNRSGRLAALKSHYRFLTESVDAEILKSIYSPNGHVLATIAVPETGDFSLRLFYRSQFEKEGDLSLGLFADSEPLPLFSLTFCANHFGNGRSELFVGGLQGHKFENQREVVVALTRAMHGLRPKALLVFALQRLSQLWNVDRILAVGDGEHIYRHVRKRKTLHAAYDEFWAECRGRQLASGNFEIPATPQSRNIAELPTNKRPLYRRRYTMLAAMGEEIHERLSGKWIIKPAATESKIAPEIVLRPATEVA